MLFVLATTACETAPPPPGSGAAVPPATDPDPDLERPPGGTAPPQPAPDRLTGLDRDDVMRLLGPADFARRDGPTEMLQYRGASCILDLFLYPGPPAGSLRVEHMETRDREMRPVPNDDCLRSLRRTRKREAG